MRIALIQMQSGIQPSSNADVLDQSIKAAADGGAAMVFTPEMSGLLDRDRERSATHIVEEIDDPVLLRVRRSAANLGVWISLGSLALKGGPDGRRLNRSFVIDAEGEIRARYDKMHLFDVDLASGESWRESSAYAPGDHAVVAETPLGSLGMSVCYDLRFPALYQALSDAGATVLAIPAAFTVPTGKAHWTVLLRARAIENACWVVAAAQSGDHEDGRKTYGHSMVVDPWGEVVLDMGEECGVGFADIDAARSEDARSRIPVLQHRKPIPEVLVAS